MQDMVTLVEDAVEQTDTSGGCSHNNRLEEASTHNGAKTHAGTGFMTCDLHKSDPRRHWFCDLRPSPLTF